MAECSDEIEGVLVMWDEYSLIVMAGRGLWGVESTEGQVFIRLGIIAEILEKVIIIIIIVLRDETGRERCVQTLFYGYMNIKGYCAGLLGV